ncbi:MAG: hypothetical protein H6631_18785 [Anaerolineaceae bacterium]|nr:hypothetical protein [Anaerolineae bacterium]MCB9079656.1 hypothetical protein [Anaerolineaceae bacterium]
MLNPRQLKKFALFLLLIFSPLTLAAGPLDAHSQPRPAISPKQAVEIAISNRIESGEVYPTSYSTMATREDLTIAKSAIATDTFKSNLQRPPWQLGGAINLWDQITAFDTQGLNTLIEMKLGKELVQDTGARLAPEIDTNSITTAAEFVGNRFKISDMGFDGGFPSVAYNSTDNEYLVVWVGDDNRESLVNDEYEIFGQRLDGTTGAEKGLDDFRISEMGPDGFSFFGAFDPAVVYNSVDNEYLVVWWGNDFKDTLGINEFEIFGQRLNSQGDQIGKDDFRISDMGPDKDPRFEAAYPEVAYNSTDNEYLVVWHGSDNTGALVSDEIEIFGQRLDGATGDEKGNDFRISEMGPDGNGLFGAFDPAVAYNSINNEYLVVWGGNDDTQTVADGEFEIFGQRLNGITGGKKGNNFRVSDVGPAGDEDFAAFYPSVTHNTTENEYLVVWWGDDNVGPLVLNEAEVFGQRLDGATGIEKGNDDFRISEMGPDGDPNFDGDHPRVVYDYKTNEYLVVWHGDDNTSALVDGEAEVYGQRLDARGKEVGDNDFRISWMGPDGNPNIDAFYPVVAYNDEVEEFLVVWYGDDDTETLKDQEFEVFGQLLAFGRQSSNPSQRVFLPIVIKTN